MNHITMATEKRINELVDSCCKYGHELNYLLNEMKSNFSYLGATISEMKRAGINLPNSIQLSVYPSYQLNGMGVIYQDIFRTVFCADLHYVNIDDFNQLVKRIYDAR